MIYCHVAKISGIAHYVTCCYAAEISSVGWGGVGGHVNVPGTSYMIYCHVAKISGIAYYVTCCYASTFEASTFDAHDVYLICQKSVDFASTFFDQNSVFQRVRKSILYCKLQVIVTLLEATKQNARAVSLPPGCFWHFTSKGAPTATAEIGFRYGLCPQSLQ